MDMVVTLKSHFLKLNLYCYKINSNYMYNTSQYMPVQQVNYNSLENIAQSAVQYSISAPISNGFYDVIPKPIITSSTEISPVNYSSVNNLFQTYSNNSQQNYISFIPQAEYHFQPDNFLKPGKEGIFVGEATQIKEHIEETYEKMFNQKFPSDVKISILNQNDFSKLAPSQGTVGLSINRSQQGLLSEIFVKNDLLGRVMLTLGHELGHVLTPTLANSVNEEAKAYAFSLLWMRVVKENDIANLGDAIVLENPARKGLHDVAFSFVMDCMNREEDLEEVYERLIKEKISVT